MSAHEAMCNRIGAAIILTREVKEFVAGVQGGAQTRLEITLTYAELEKIETRLSLAYKREVCRPELEWWDNGDTR
jgi:hypothetical protein